MGNDNAEFRYEYCARSVLNVSAILLSLVLGLIGMGALVGVLRGQQALDPFLILVLSFITIIGSLGAVWSFGHSSVAIASEWNFAGRFCLGPRQRRKTQSRFPALT